MNGSAQVAAVIVGALLFTLILQDAFEVMLLPRRVKRRWRLTRYYFRAFWRLWRAAASLWPQGERRERFLSIFGSLAMTLLFSLWAVTLIIAFGLMQWAAQAHPVAKGALDLGDQIYFSGVTFFTLGFGDLSPHTGWAKFLAVFEAGVGFGLIAVVIGYLPVLYQLFSNREAHVLQLDARAGSPPSAVTLLCRHAESGALDQVDDVLRVWEIWGAQLLESHLSYPMLAYYRSQHEDQSWLAALMSIIDACALILVGVEDVRQLQARMTFATARQVILEMARSLEVTTPAAPTPTRLSREDYAAILALFGERGVAWNGGEAAEQTLAVVRATYEPLALALAEYLLISPAPWLPVEEATDHWQRGARGIIARNMVQGLADGSLSTEAPISAGRLRRWRRRHGTARG